MEEASTGRMSQPQRCKPSDFSSGSPLTRRFGVTQLTSKGVLKIRCIDDFTASLVNLSACTDEKLFHNHLDGTISLVDVIAEDGHRFSSKRISRERTALVLYILCTTSSPRSSYGTLTTATGTSPPSTLFHLAP